MSHFDFGFDLLVAGVLTLAILVAGPLAYLVTSRWAHRKGSRSPEDKLSDEQMRRYQVYPHAAGLQLATNRAHNKALDAKTRYHILGIAASSVGPSLLLVAAFGRQITRNSFVTERALHLLELLLIVALALLVFTNFRPTDAYHRLRLRAELLRSYLHAYLAGVGPYRDPGRATEELGTLGGRIGLMDVRAALGELRSFSERCLLQSGESVWQGSLPLTVNMIAAYVPERVFEQSTYFTTAEGREERAYRRSTQVIGVALIAASLAALGRIWLPNVEAWPLVVVSASAAGVLVLALRAVFGWDSRAELYYRQGELLAELARRLQEIKKRSEASGTVTSEDILAFRKAAARFESLMAREACDWAMITDRRYYDATI